MYFELSIHHGRAWSGNPRLASLKEGVDTRHKAGHDGGNWWGVSMP
jgi:hypothetical protein